MKVKLAFFFLSILSFFDTRTITKGSFTLPSLEALFTFPENVGVLGPNKIVGFGWFNSGFSLENSATNLIYNAVCPVSGSVDLKGGTLTLQSDLIFQNSTTLAGLGVVEGGSHSIKLCSSITSFPSNTQSFNNTNIFCDADLSLNSAVTFKGTSLLCGVDNMLDLATGAEIVVDSNSKLTLRNLEIRGIKSNNIRCVDDTGILILDNVRWIQDDSVAFSKGILKFRDCVEFMGSSTFSYSSAFTSTIESASQLIIHDGMCLSMGRNVNTLHDPIAFEDRTSSLKLDNCSLIVSGSGLQLTKGTLILDRKVDLDIIASTTAHGLIFGNGNMDDDITIWLTPGCSVWHNRGYLVYNNGSPNKLKSASASSRMIRNLNSQIFVPQDFTIDSVTVQLVSNLVSPMSVAAGKTLLYINAAVMLPDVQFEMTAQQLNAFTYSFNNENQIFFTKGTLPLYLVVNGSGNRLKGNGGVSGSITLLSSASEVTCSHTFINNAITLNNGKIILENDLLVLAKSSLVGPGNIDLQSNQLTVSIGSMNANTPICWHGDNGTLSLKGKTSLSSTWTISGKCNIDANNNRIILAENGAIVVDKNAELVIKNAEIHGVANNNIRCVDSTGRITFINNNCLLDNNYSFTIGAMQFYRQNTVSGPYVFSYDSPQTSTIKSDAQLTIQDGATFLTGRHNGNEPLAFDDNNSMIKFDNGKFSVKESGMKLLKGTVISTRDVEISVASQQESGSLVFGDGTSNNDMKFIVSPGSTARFLTGHVTFNVTSGDGIKSKSKTAELIRGSSSQFLLKQNLMLADISIDVDPLSSLVIDPGKVLSYSNGRIVIDQGTFDLTGIRYSDTTTLLNGNHKISLVNGSFPMATLVVGTGNVIDGNGTITGPVILQNSLSELTCAFAGDMRANIALTGGKLILSSDLYCANNVLMSSSGIVNMDTSNIHLGKANLSWASNILWQGNNASLNLHANVDLASTWTFSGQCILKGNGNTIKLGEFGQLVVDRNSQLCLQDIKLENINGTNIRCIDDTGILFLDDVDWKQPYGHTYTFTAGALRIKNRAIMRGNAIFVYETPITSTIHRESYLKFDTNMTFSYYPSNNDKALLEMENNTSQLILNNASLCTTVSGMQLTKGRSIFRGDCTVVADYKHEEQDGITTKIQEGIIFGTGDQEDDCTCVVAGGSRVTFVQGKLSYRNVLSSSFVMENRLSILKFESDTLLALLHDLSVGIGQLIMHEKALLQSSNNAEILGSVFIEQAG